MVNKTMRAVMLILAVQMCFGVFNGANDMVSDSKRCKFSHDVTIDNGNKDMHIIYMRVATSGTITAEDQGISCFATHPNAIYSDFTHP